MHEKVPYGVKISQVFVILLYIQALLAQVNLLLQDVAQHTFHVCVTQHTFRVSNTAYVSCVFILFYCLFVVGK